MEGGSWKPTKTIPLVDMEKSLELMDQHQVDINIVEISLLALNNETILQWMINNMHRHEFYLKYRYILQTVINGKLSETHKKTLNTAISKFDQRFVNGPEQMCYSEKMLLNMPFEKQKRLKFISDKKRIICKIDQLSEMLFKLEDFEEKRAYFEEQISSINQILQEKDEDKKENGYQSTALKGFIFCFGHSLRKLVNINIKTSFFIQTKNRNPLVLDFQFAHFLYKKDDQLAHQIIAMELIKYFNTILGKKYIIPYEIIPEERGALYEFIEHAQTIHQIKSREEDGLISYFSGKTPPEAAINTFAQTYSGFCLIQYLLDIKDRNNANIMIRQDGAIFHIDLAFIFGVGPGGLNFESAPFKMTREYIKVLGGFESDAFRKFQSLMVQHFTKLLQCKKEIIWKLQILAARSKEIRCFKDFDIKDFSKKLPKKQDKVKQFVEDLIDNSYDSWKTTKYDEFQFRSNNILK